MSIKQIIGQFEVQGILGSGGIGHVHAAVDRALGREVAIKSLRPELLNDKAFLDRFRAEAINLARLNHPNIATLYSLIEEGGNLYMVMELVRGKSLEDIIAERAAPFGIREATAIIAQAAEGMAYAHEMGIVHRDIKPANLMITENGRVKVMDFGIARMRGSQRLTRDGSIVGTLAYISPEQLKGKEGDERSDLYSLAVLFYELLAGKAPFQAETDYDLIQAHVNEAPPKLGPLVPGLPPAIDAAITKALAKKPETRFASVSEFAAALGEDAIRLNATSIIKSPEALLQAEGGQATTSARTSHLASGQSLKSRFLKLPVEVRGLAIGGVAAVVLGAAIVIPPLFASPPPRAVATTSANPPPIPGLPLPQPIIVQAAPTASQSAQSSASSLTSSRNFPLAAAEPPKPAESPPPAVTAPALPLPPPAPVIAAPPVAATAAMPASPPAIEATPQATPPSTATTSSAAADPQVTIDQLQRAYYISKDDAAAFGMAKALAAKGDAEAQFILGNIYRNGRGTTQSHIQAAHWYELAAEQQHARAANNLAALYEDRLISADPKIYTAKAATYFIKAAGLGLASAQFRAGIYYERGLGGLPASREKAIEFYRKAAEQNVEEARQRLRQLGTN